MDSNERGKHQVLGNFSSLPHEARGIDLDELRDRVTRELAKMQAQKAEKATRKHEPMGQLRNGGKAGNPNNAKRCNAMSKRTRERCQAPAIKGKAKCRFHGGKSTGAKTPEGKKASRNGNYKHGGYSIPLIQIKRSFTPETGWKKSVFIRPGIPEPEIARAKAAALKSRDSQSESSSLEVLGDCLVSCGGSSWVSRQVSYAREV